MVQVLISNEEKLQLFKERFTHPHPHIQKKCEALYLQSCELHNELICSILQIDGNTLRSYFKEFNDGGIAKLKAVHFYRPQSNLQAFSSGIESYFRENPSYTITRTSQAELPVKSYFFTNSFKNSTSFFRCSFSFSNV